MNRWVKCCLYAIFTASQIAGCGPSNPPSDGTTDAAVDNLPTASLGQLEAALRDTNRSADDRALDATRNPVAILAFFGIAPGMTILDVNATGGYYTELLAAAVGPSGMVYAQNDTATLERQDGAVAQAISARLSGNRLPNVRRLDRDVGEMGLSEEVDAALLMLTLHDFYNFRGEDATVALLRDTYAALKVGGTLGVVDHVGEASPTLDLRELHRIEEAVAERLLREAGFVIEAKSDLLRNSADTHEQSVFDESIRRRTDRFVIRARKP